MSLTQVPFPKFTDKSVELARLIAKQFGFRGVTKDTDIQIESMGDHEDDAMNIGEFTLQWVEKMEDCVVEGEKTSRIVPDQYVINLTMFVAYPYRYDEPPDGDTEDLGDYRTLIDALAEIAAMYTRLGVQNWYMDYSMPQEEQNDSAGH